MQLSWRQIEVFKGVMAVGSVTQAASLLRTSQPTVSRELAGLEESLGFALFERRSRRLFATKKGLQFYEQVKRCFVGLDQLVQSAEAIRGDVDERVQVACLPLLAQTLMPQVAARFLREEPQARLSVHALDQSRLLRELLGGRFSFGVVETGVAVDGTWMEEIELGEEVVVLPTAHPLTAKKTLRPSDLTGERFISFPDDDMYSRRFDKLLEEAQIVRPLRLEASTAEAVCAMVKFGLGVSIVNPITARAFEGRGVAFRRLSISIPFKVGLCRPFGYRTSGLSDKFAHCVLEECKAMRIALARSMGVRARKH